jgi:MPBQ/MSBQ methyltransferase
MRLIQHKKEAYWFYRFLSALYDRWVNPLFWTPRMRDEALALARLDAPDLDVVDVGAGTGFATEGIVRSVRPLSVTMLDQSPHQLARAAKKPVLSEVRKVRGDAEALPFETDRFDRYVSTGSIEYWPDPQRAIAEAYRVLKPGGRAMLAGPLPPRQPIARKLAELWMLFPPEGDYRGWFQAAGFADVEVAFIAPDWHGGGPSAYGIAIAGRKPAAGESPVGPASVVESVDEPMTPRRRALFAARFVVGSAAGAAFVPIAAVLALRERVRR